MDNVDLISRLMGAFEDEFHEKPVIVRSPGRINVLGEHTDYNDGFVLPAAIDKAAYLAISLRKDDEIHMLAMDLQERFTSHISNLKPLPKGGWPNFLLGSAAQVVKSGVSLRGFNAVLTSDVPIGAGLSSSAAIECCMVYGLNELLKLQLDRMTMIKMAQKAEHEFAGVLCGIMDQFASMMGKKDHIIKLDCRSLDYEYIPFQWKGIKIVLLNSNVKHSLAASEYNVRRIECESATKLIRTYVPSVQSLRDATHIMLDQYVLPADKRLERRARFIVEENERLQNGCLDLINHDLKALGNKMFATHDGLSKKYEVSCRELDWLVNAVRYNGNVIGARMMGGGFGGCTLNLVKEDAVDQLIDSLKSAYEKEMKLPLTYYITSIEEGTCVIR